jgi:hypothetical protein
VICQVDQDVCIAIASNLHFVFVDVCINQLVARFFDAL